LKSDGSIFVYRNRERILPGPRFPAQTVHKKTDLSGTRPAGQSDPVQRNLVPGWKPAAGSLPPARRRLWQQGGEALCQAGRSSACPVRRPWLFVRQPLIRGARRRPWFPSRLTPVMAAGRGMAGCRTPTARQARRGRAPGTGAAEEAALPCCSRPRRCRGEGRQSRRDGRNTTEAARRWWKPPPPPLKEDLWAKAGKTIASERAAMHPAPRLSGNLLGTRSKRYEFTDGNQSYSCMQHADSPFSPVFKDPGARSLCSA